MLGEYEACYRPKAALCVNDVVYTMTFGTIEKTIDYLCVEGFEGRLVGYNMACGGLIKQVINICISF